MGVSKFRQIVEYVPQCTTTKYFKDFCGTTQSLDASPILYAFCIATMKTNNYKNTDGKMISHLFGCFFKSISMLKYGIKPLWVFDGTPPRIKMHTLDNRRKTKKNAYMKLEELSKYSKYKENYTEQMSTLSREERHKLEKKSFSITKNHINDVKQLLILLGLPYSDSPGEAEAQCAAYNRANISDGVVTGDWDALLFGCKIMLTNFSNKNKIIEINNKNLLNALDMTQEQLIMLGTILGNDYCTGIRGINPVDAYKKFKRVNYCIDIFLDNIRQEGQYVIPNNFMRQMRESCDYYLNAPVVNPSNINVTWEEPEYDKLFKYLVTDHKMDPELIVPKINELRLMYSYYKQDNTLVTLTQIKRDLNILDLSSGSSYYNKNTYKTRKPFKIQPLHHSNGIKRIVRSNFKRQEHGNIQTIHKHQPRKKNT